jgi:hypothetical protein
MFYLSRPFFARNGKPSILARKSLIFKPFHRNAQAGSAPPRRVDNS